MFTDNAYATILICSYLGVKDGNYRPYTALQWSELGPKIVNSPIGEPAGLLNMDAESISKNLNLSMDESERIAALISRGANIAFLLEEMSRKGISVITRSDKRYPSKLKSLLKKNSPPLLYYCGDLLLANKDGIGIVGSRNIDEEGTLFARNLAEKAAKENLVVFSGGAKGIDTISETAALNSSGSVVSVLADSLSKKIKNKDVRENILNGKLLLLSAVNPDAPFSAASAMNRNKYIYTLSNGTFVVASDYNKGGTWTGAVENLKNEWVNTFVWNNKKYNGNSELIKKGGISVDSIENISIRELIRTSIDKRDQINIFELDDANKEMNIDSANVVKEKTELYVNFDKNNENEFDVYNKIIEILLKFLSEPKSVDEITYALNITKTQAIVWINRALEDGKINKINKPIRYVTSNQ